MKKVFLTTLAAVLLAVASFAQTVDAGIKSLYYERNDEAITVLKQAVSANSKDVMANYWLGQAYLAKKDYAGAKAVYQAALTAGLNDPYIWIGSGHVQLLEGGDKNSAKQKFEQAITATKKKTEDPNILLAIGRANADGGREFGDANYGIEKLKRANELDKKNPEIPYQLGISYLKLGGERGGEAVEAFRESITRDPKYAKAMYRIGKIYESQENKESMEKWYGDAIAADQSFAPAYLAFFQWYQNRDVNAAKEFLDKFIANSPKSCETDFFQADYLFRAGKYQESLNKAKQMEATCATYYQLPILYSYNYERLGDTVQAKTYLEKYVSTAKAEQITSDQALFGASLLKRFKGSEQGAIALLTKALNTDTVTKSRIKLMDTISAMYKRTGDIANSFAWAEKSYKANANPSNRNLFDYASAAAASKNYALTDQLFNEYITKYPDQAAGYFYRVKFAMESDSTNAKAIEPINQYITFLDKDREKNKASMIYYHSVLAQYYANTVKDYANAINEFKKILELDPGNADAPKYIAQLEKILNKKNSAPAKPAGKGTTTPAKSAK
jgi:tetratricopeptide (TPR) repeat protein